MKKNFVFFLFSIYPVLLLAQKDSIFIKEVKVNNRVMLLNDSLLLLNAKDDDVEIVVASMRDSVINFTYILEGFDHVFHHTKQQIRYTNLHGGNYVLQVSANNCNALKLTIQVEYTLFEEAWFEYSFLFYIMLLILGIAYVWKIYDNRKKAQLAKLKNKLVADLHDDIGSSLTSIIVFTKLLQKSKLPNEDTIEISNDILETAQESIDHLRDIVEVLRPSNDNFYDLLEKLKNYAHKLLKAKEIDFIYSSSPENNWQEKMKNKEVNMKLNLNAYFIFKEIINNIIKHAQADKVSISVVKESDEIIFTIKDNGKGFDISQDYKGFGMTTLQQRAAESYIGFDLQSAIGEGTSIVIKIPII